MDDASVEKSQLGLDVKESQSWETLLGRGQAREALAVYLNTTEPEASVREDLRALVNLRVALREKDWAKASGYAQAITALDLDTVALEQDLAILQAAGKQLDKHRPDEVKSLSNIRSPLLQAEVCTLRGTAAIYDNDTAEAKRLFEAALENDPHHYRALTNLGNLALESGDTDAAIAAYEKALKLNDTFANAHHNLGVAYRRKGQLNKSVRSLRKAQGVAQRQMRESTRESLKEVNPGVKRSLRWVLYAVLAVVAYFFLQRQGIL